MDESGAKSFTKTKRKLFSKQLKCPNTENIEHFKVYNKIYNKIRRAAKKLYYDGQFQKFAKDSKQTWSVIREIIGTNTDKSQIPTFFSKNQVISDYLEIANDLIHSLQG